MQILACRSITDDVHTKDRHTKFQKSSHTKERLNIQNGYSYSFSLCLSQVSCFRMLLCYILVFHSKFCTLLRPLVFLFELFYICHLGNFIADYGVWALLVV